ncbi:hypothetical protein ACC685_39110, partial [Rhizobium ruizarguesonis]
VAEQIHLDHQVLQFKLRIGARIGVEYDTHGMTGRVARLLDEQLTTFGQIVDASYLVSRLRLIKSPTEVAYVERAAVL